MRKICSIAVTLILTATVLFGSLAQTACGDSDIRAGIRDGVSAGRAVFNAVRAQLPPGDPRIDAIERWNAALIRFSDSFNAAQNDAERNAAVLLFADVVSGFAAAVLPLLPIGGIIGLAIVAADVALRILANRLSPTLQRLVDLRDKQGHDRELALAKLPRAERRAAKAMTPEQWQVLERYQTTLRDYLARPVAQSPV